MKLIVGLGNIGVKYARTRHNLGFMVLDELTSTHQLPTCIHNDKFNADIVEASLAGEKILLVKPTTMMNLSGEAVGSLMRFYKLSPEDIWVIYDEVDLGFGRLRVRRGGSSAGHNGVKSVSAAIGEGFVRFRIGVANELLPERDTADFVLSAFTKEEQGSLPRIVGETVRILTEHLTKANFEDTTYTLLT